MASIQTLGDADRRAVARWALVCAERVLRLLPQLGTDSSGPLGVGLLSHGILGATIRQIQAQIGSAPRREVAL